MAETRPDRSRDAAFAWIAAIATLATILVANVAPARGPAPHPVATSPAEDPGCREWTDSCRVCTRGADGVHCSTPGFACQREALRCTGR
ncbi:hypothetical protein [Methylobacterium frigidaeris]|uniref:Uncharacterized protein n=1 Tax=Methylobacterium frigidaeris TaxID=2038277 RepID=A0AA37HBE7_9HYPH|nr:hypothetical protein [Methylobacterium frigidaeris]PIK70962.1 hypothetical protein CS379_21890 [Methylobacterium frigidaeris]GJD62907.1 hypothetical protein MPEAHAMD_3066 [Methylobacterium frigidaeris]